VDCCAVEVVGCVGGGVFTCGATTLDEGTTAAAAEDEAGGAAAAEEEEPVLPPAPPPEQALEESALGKVWSVWQVPSQRF